MNSGGLDLYQKWNWVGFKILPIFGGAEFSSKMSSDTIFIHDLSPKLIKNMKTIYAFKLSMWRY